MTGRSYTALNRFMWSHPRFAGVIIKLDTIITAIGFASYPLFLIFMSMGHIGMIPRLMIIPAFGIAAVSLFRYRLGFERPYERFSVTPLIKKDTTGASFPSRHVFSIFMLAETYLYAQADPLAYSFYIGGLVLMVCRVLLGVHFISDVVCGAVVALFFGLLYYF